MQPPSSLVPGVVWGSMSCARGSAAAFQPVPWPCSTAAGKAVAGAPRFLQPPMKPKPLLLPHSPLCPAPAALAAMSHCVLGLRGVQAAPGCGERRRRWGAPQGGTRPLVSGVCVCGGFAVTVIQPPASAACGQRPRRAARASSRLVGVAPRLGKLPA